MFRTKYTISILDSKWLPIKRGIKLPIIPRANEFIFIDDEYYQVSNVVHSLNKKQDIFIIVEKFGSINPSDNQQDKK